MNIATFSVNKWRFWGENMNNHNRIKIQNADTRLRVYLYRAELKSKRKRLRFDFIMGQYVYTPPALGRFCIFIRL